MNKKNFIKKTESYQFYHWYQNLKQLNNGAIKPIISHAFRHMSIECKRMPGVIYGTLYGQTV